MIIKKFGIGPLLTNSYLVEDKGKCILFDIGGMNIEKIIDYIEEKKLILKALMLTHGHYDHIMGIEKLVEYKSDIKIYIGEKELEFLYDGTLNLSALYGNGISIDKGIKIETIKGGDIVEGFEVIETPGHTRGGVVYYSEKDNFMIVGDTIFKGAYGRTDFPTGDSYALFESIKEILEYPLNTKLFCGHEGETTIGEEKKRF